VYPVDAYQFQQGVIINFSTITHNSFSRLQQKLPVDLWEDSGGTNPLKKLCVIIKIILQVVDIIKIFVSCGIG
jgi:hypothetical protein